MPGAAEGARKFLPSFLTGLLLSGYNFSQCKVLTQNVSGGKRGIACGGVMRCSMTMRTATRNVSAFTPGIITMPDADPLATSPPETACVEAGFLFAKLLEGNVWERIGRNRLWVTRCWFSTVITSR